MKVTRIGTFRRMQVLILDRFVLVDVMRSGDAVHGVIQVGIMMPSAGVPPGGMPIDKAVAAAEESGRRGGESELFVYDPNGLWPG